MDNNQNLDLKNENASSVPISNRLIEIIIYFFRLGLTGFGGPLAIIARLHKETISELRWVSAHDFQAGMSVIKILPGPVSTQLSIYIGYLRAGRVGGFLAGIFFILPSFLMMIGIANIYDSTYEMPMVSNILRGLQAAAYILIIISLYDLSKPYHVRSHFWAWFIISLILIVIFRVTEPIVILLSAGLAAFAGTLGRRTMLSIPLDLLFLGLIAGGFSFGTGLSIVPLLQGSVVDKFHWLTREQFLDAIAFGQMTPGPVLITLTFIGYKVYGFWGALIATVAVFAPSFVNILTWFPFLMKWFNRQKWLNHFVMGATAALSAGVLSVLIKMGHDFAFAEFFLPFLLVLLSKRKLPSWAVLGITGIIFGILGKLLL
jgi:chromate transporter